MVQISSDIFTTTSGEAGFGDPHQEAWDHPNRIGTQDKQIDPPKGSRADKVTQEI